MVSHPFARRKAKGWGTGCWATFLFRGSDPDEQDVVAVQCNGLVVGQGDVFAGVEIFAGFGTFEAELRKAQMEGMGGDAIGAGVKDGDGHCSAGEMPGPDFDLAVYVVASSL